MSRVVVEAKGLRKVYPIRRGMFREPAQLQAVGGVSFTLEEGRTLAVVGESGCGKSTLARMVSLIEKPTEGSLMLDGTDAVQTPASERRRLRQAVRPELREWQGGQVRCHYPLGDPSRQQQIARDVPVRVETAA